MDGTVVRSRCTAVIFVQSLHILLAQPFSLANLNSGLFGGDLVSWGAGDALLVVHDGVVVVTHTQVVASLVVAGAGPEVVFEVTYIVKMWLFFARLCELNLRTLLPGTLFQLMVM